MHCAYRSLARPLLNLTRSLATAPRHATNVGSTHTRTMAAIPRIDFPIQLVLDFDGTLTYRDTMHLVAETGYIHQTASDRIPQPPPWSEIVNAYMTDFGAHAKNYRPQAMQRTSPEQESVWLDSLEQIEEVSFQRVLDAGIFDHLTVIEMETAGKMVLHNGHLQLRPGWHELTMRLRQHNATFSQLQFPTRILSVNWSATFIGGVVQQASEELQTKEPLVHAHHIYANEIPSIAEAGGTSATENTSIRTSGDKAGLLQKFRQTADDKEKALLMYVGDSATDLDCLLTADLGFCVRDDPMTSSQKELADTCQRIGVGICPITEALDRSDKEKILWWIRDFSEVVDWLDRVTNA